MKQSGIDWIGEIPDDWKINQLSQIVSQVKNKNIGLKENNLLSLSYGKIKNKDINTNDGLLPASFDGYNIIGDGDIVLRLTDLQNDHTSLRVGRATEQGIITSAYTTLHPVDYDNSKYLYYILHSFDLKKGFYGMGSGVRQGLNYDEVKTLKVPLPPKATQQRIAEYLDSKCAQIDSIIEESKKSIEEYKAWKQSVIFEAVTGKCHADSILLTQNPDEKKEIPLGISNPCGNKMKDSGIEWIGEIPKGWKCLSLKNLCSMQSGKNLISEQIALSGLYPVYGGNGIRGWYDDFNTDGNYILIGRQGALCGNVHKVSGKFWATEHAVVTTPKDLFVIVDYLYYLLVGMNLNQYASNSAAQPGLSVNAILNVKTVLPPLSEQKSIAKMLDSKCAQIDSLIAEKESLIADLTEYKKSLIFEVVTGKRSV